MTQYTHLDLTKTPPLIIGFYDTVFIRYTTLPPMNELVELSPTDWARRTSELWWTVTDGTLVPYPGNPT